MKKLIALLLALCMVLSLAACGGDSGSDATNPGGSNNPTDGGNSGGANNPTDSNDPQKDPDEPGDSDNEDETTEPTQAVMDFSDVENPLGLNCLALAAMFANSDLEEPMTAEMLKYISEIELRWNDWNDTTSISFRGYIPDPEGGYNGTSYSGYGTISGVLDLSGDTLDAFWEDLKNIEELERLRVEHLPLENLEGLVHHSAIDWLYISYSDSLTSLNGTENLTNLRFLYCNYCPNLSDISALANLTSLESLELADGNITDLTPLAGLTTLEELRLYNNPISDISPLADLPNLEQLNFRGTQVTELPAGGTTRVQSISYPDGMTGLGNLSQWVADGASLSLTLLDNISLEGFENFTHIRSLNLTGSGITNEDLAYLSNVAIDQLLLGGTPITDLSALAGNTGLKEIDISGTGVTDLSPLATCTGLEKLYAAGTAVTEVNGLAGMESLRVLSLEGTPITDLSSIAGLPNLESLTLQYCESLTDVSPLVNCPSLKYLSLARCENITDISALAASTTLVRITIMGIEGLDTSAFEGTEIELRDYI